MDLVSRLKEYIKRIGVPVTQFADICGIARPTLSQLLNGRNKKVSDEIVAKIHAAFPSLSVYWLMFGEGNMEIIENIKISEGNNLENLADENFYLFDNQNKNEKNEEGKNLSDSSQPGIIEFFERKSQDDMSGEERQKMIQERLLFRPDKESEDISSKVNNERGKAVSIAVNHGEGKLITNIVVFYSDSSFQSFYPV